MGLFKRQEMPPFPFLCLFGISEAPVIEGYRDSFFALPHRFSEKIFIKGASCIIVDGPAPLKVQNAALRQYVMTSDL